MDTTLETKAKIFQFCFKKFWIMMDLAKKFEAETLCWIEFGWIIKPLKPDGGISPSSFKIFLVGRQSKVMDVYQQERVMDFQLFAFPRCGCVVLFFFFLSFWIYTNISNSLLPLNCYHLRPDRPEGNNTIRLGHSLDL